MLKWALDLFFPPVCGICGKQDLNWLCDKCEKELYIKKKSKIIEIYGKSYEEIVYLFLYKDIRNLILQYKFFNKAYLSNMFSKIILRDKKICDKLKLYDIIISVPMNKNKKAKRGYNQTELIAFQIAKNLNLKYNKNCLKKVKQNLTQSTLKEKDRRKNVENVFEINEVHFIKDKNIIIFDDIVTTGATVQECARILKVAGAKKIIILSIAKD